MTFPVAETRHVFKRGQRYLKLGTSQVAKPDYLGSGFADSYGDWQSKRQPPDRLVLDVDGKSIAKLWTHLPEPLPQSPQELEVGFPPACEHIICANIDNVTHWNRSSVVLEVADAQAIAWVEDTIDWTKDPLDWEAEILSSSQRCAAWIRGAAKRYRRYGQDEFDLKATWEGLLRRNPAFCSRLVTSVVAPSTVARPRLVIIDMEYGTAGPRSVGLEPTAWWETEEDDLALDESWRTDDWWLREP